MSPPLSFAFELTKILLTQLIGLFGIFFAFGFILSHLQESIQRRYVQAIGWKGILWTAWIGTPIHELGHLFFAKLFRHHITHVSFFSPNQATGGLGHVEHTYNRLSLYQRIGNFFIGAAPLIFGSSILLALLYLMLPNGKEIFLPIASTIEKSSWLLSLQAFQDTLFHLFRWTNISSATFWIFLYLSFCISSHMAPSANDRRSMWGGFFWLVLTLMVINVITLLLGVNITAYLLSINQYVGIFTAMFVYATGMSMLHWLCMRLLVRRS